VSKPIEHIKTKLGSTDNIYTNSAYDQLSASFVTLIVHN